MARLPRGGRVAANGGPMQGLAGAMSNNDPLGIAAQQRSVAGELQGIQQIPFGSDPMGIARNAAMQSYQNSASDPMRFNTMMQSLNENAPGGIRTPSGRGNPMPGVPTSPFAASSTMWQPGQISAVSGKQFDPSFAVRGLQKA